MGKFSETMLPAHQKFISEQLMFFVATAPLSHAGHVNLSPKGMDTFRILSDSKVAYLDFIGSGNETSAHIRENGRLTVMFCAFKGAPNILRLYGKGSVLLPDTEGWSELENLFPDYPNTRQIIVLEVDLVQTACGFGVPLYEYVGERTQFGDWSEKKGRVGLDAYIQEKNLVSLDGLPTHYN